MSVLAQSKDDCAGEEMGDNGIFGGEGIKPTEGGTGGETETASGENTGSNVETLNGQQPKVAEGTDVSEITDKKKPGALRRFIKRLEVFAKKIVEPEDTDTEK